MRVDQSHGSIFVKIDGLTVVAGDVEPEVLPLFVGAPGGSYGSSNGLMKFGVDVDNGGGFNAATGEYVCVKAGLHRIVHANKHTHNEAENTHISTAMKINDVVYASRTTYSYAYDPYRYDAYNDIKWLEVGDRVAPYATSCRTNSHINIGSDRGVFTVEYLPETYKVVAGAESTATVEPVELGVQDVIARDSIDPLRLVKTVGYDVANDCVIVAETTEPGDVVLGVCVAGLGAGAKGSIVTDGLITDVNTVVWAQDATMYAGYDGQMTTPKLPGSYQVIGKIVTSSSIDGSIQVNIGAVIEDSAGIDASNFSTVDPHLVGVLWLDNGRIVVSEGV